MNNSNYTVFKNVDRAYQIMLDAIRGAQSCIILEQYCLAGVYPTGIGADFIEALTERARAGVDVTLYLDAIGSYEVYSNDQLVAMLRDNDINVQFYRTMKQWIPINIMRLLLRNHRKLLCVDGQVVYLGGVIIGEKYTQWQDLLVSVSTPNIVQAITDHADTVGNKQGLHAFTFSPIIIDETHQTRLVGNSPGLSNRHVAESIYRHIRDAQNQITIVTPYFCPPTATWWQLLRAAKRSVTISVYVPMRTDHRIVDWVHDGFYRVFLRNNITVYRNQHMNHAKLVMIDDWYTFGSTNFDNLSFIFNHELNLESTEPTLGQQLQTYITGLKDHSKILKPTDLQRGFHATYMRMLGYLVRFFA